MTSSCLWIRLAQVTDGSTNRLPLAYLVCFFASLAFWWPSKDDSSDGRRGTNHLAFQVNNNNVSILEFGGGSGGGGGVPAPVPINHHPLWRVGGTGEANPPDSPLPLSLSSPPI